MKKIYFLVFILVFIIGFGGALYWQSSSEKQAIHIFTEGYATNPALTQMIQFVQLPKSTQKIIAWHRFPKRRNVLDLKAHNTTELDFPQHEVMGDLLSDQAVEKISQIRTKNPHQNFVLHGNLSHVAESIYPFLRVIPHKNIVRVHLYEDGYGELFKGKKFQTAQTYAPPLDSEMKTLIETGKGEWEGAMNFSLQKMYPTTYHLMHADKIKDVNYLKPLVAWMENAKIQNVDFDSLRNTLTPEQKQTLYKLTGFDYKRYEPLMKNKPTIVFVMGYFFGVQEREQAEQNWLNALKDELLPPLPEGQNYTWFYKPHPTLDGKDVTSKMAKNFPDIIPIPAQIPFEILIIANLKPTYTVGFSSSLFYSLKSSDILYYAVRPNDIYLPFLMKYGILRKKQLVGMAKYMQPN